MLCLIPSYNWLVSTITCLWKPKIKSFINSKPIFSIVNGGNNSLLGRIINKNYMYSGSNVRRIAFKKLPYIINKSC